MLKCMATCIVVDSISIVDISVSFSVSYVIVWYIIIKNFNMGIYFIGNKNWRNVTFRINLMNMKQF